MLVEQVSLGVPCAVLAMLIFFSPMYGTDGTSHV